MAKPKTPRAKAKAFAADSILDDTNPNPAPPVTKATGDGQAGTPVTETTNPTPSVVAATDGGQAPAPAQGNEGKAATAGEGQPSLATPAPPADASAETPEGQGGPAPDQDAGKKTDEGAEGPSLVVTGPKKGRWRAGRKFGAAPVTLLVSDLNEAELAALMADGRLAVKVVDAPY